VLSLHMLGVLKARNDGLYHRFDPSLPHTQMELDVAMRG